RAYGATEWQIFWKIVLPAAIPFIMAGIRPAGGLGVIRLLLAEVFSALRGGGRLVRLYAHRVPAADPFVPSILIALVAVGVIVIALVGVVLTEFVMWLERRMSRWRQLERERF